VDPVVALLASGAAPRFLQWRVVAVAAAVVLAQAQLMSVVMVVPVVALQVTLGRVRRTPLVVVAVRAVPVALVVQEP
jgi:hypothetical protein